MNPFSTVWRKVANSTAYRSGSMYKQLLRHWPARGRAGHSAAELSVITMTGAKHWLLLEQMLYTLSLSWNVLPAVHVLSDGTLQPADVENLRRRYPGMLTCIDFEKIENHHAERDRTELVRFSRENYFGRKLAYILYAAERQPSLWVDNDVLFFGDFSADLRRLAQGAPVLMGATCDCSFGKSERFFGYDVALAEHLFAGNPNTPAINAGFTFANGPIYDALQLQPVVAHALAGEHTYLTEQTIVAWASLQSGGVLWDRETVYLDDKDAGTLGPTYRNRPWKARHYTGNVRHLFWRDALFRRFDRN